MKRILLLVLCLALFACTEEPKPGKIVSIELTEEDLTILVGEFGSTIAYVEKDNPANCDSTVEWSSSNESIAVAHANGDECLIEGISPGEAIITANTPEGLSATCKVTVVAKVIPVTGISLSKVWLEILENRTETLTAFLKPSDATNTKVTWSSTDESIATVNDGTVRGIKPGRAKIKAETEDGGFVAECDVTVTKDYQSQSKGPVTLKLGNVTASTVTFFGTLDVDQLGDYDMADGGVGFIYTTTDKTLNVSNAKKVKITTVGSNNEFSFTYTGLPYDTRYHYTVFLYKNGICQYGSTQYFKTEDVNINVDEVTTGTSSATFKGTTSLLWGDRSAINVGIQYSKYDSFSSTTTINLSDSTETFEYKREGLAYATKYYYRTYIKQNSSYKYGNAQEFTTQPISVSIGVDNLTQTTATFSGNIDLAGGEGISIGVRYWPVSGGDTIKKSFSDIDENGNYSITVKDLKHGTQYRYSYYTYQNGSYIYGDTQEFTTAAIPVTISTGEITQTTATFKGKAELSEPDAVEIGVRYSTKSTDFSSSSMSSSATEVSFKDALDGEGNFNSKETGLLHGTKYYYAYYIKQAGKYTFGSVQDFTTQTVVPNIDIAEVTQTTATFSGNVSFTESGIIKVGIRYSTENDGFTSSYLPYAAAEFYVTDTMDANGSFTKKVSGLSYGTKYYYCYFVVQNGIYTFGNVKEFSTQLVEPDIKVGDITQTTATFSGIVDITEPSSIQVGIRYSASSNDFSSSYLPDGAQEFYLNDILNSEGQFTQKVTGLYNGKKYYYCYFVVQNGEYVFGNVYDFTMHNVEPEITVGEVTQTTASFSGKILLSESDVIEVGLLYSASSTNPKVTTSGVNKVDLTDILNLDGSYSYKAINLLVNTSYYYRYYIKQGNEYTYGTTKQIMVKSVPLSLSVKDITLTSAVFSGEVSFTEENVVEVGILYSTGTNLKVGENGVTQKRLSSTSGAFMLEDNQLFFGTTYNWCHYFKQGDNYIYGTVQQFNTADIEGENLSSDATANCYVVSKSGWYKFKTVQGNSTVSVGNVSSSEVLWESFGTDIVPNVGDLIQVVICNEEYIAFKTSDEYKHGNALIGARDASGNIIWSWHIWFRFQPSGISYSNNAGIMMTENLGATYSYDTRKGECGLLYQWGRKDPFLGYSTMSFYGGNILSRSTISVPPPVSSNSSNGTIEYATANPTTFILKNSRNNDWHYTGTHLHDDTLWSRYRKTIYDPCPIGWRIPSGGPNGVWETALGSFLPSYEQTNTSDGLYLDGCYYQACGFIDCEDGSLTTGAVGSKYDVVYWSNNLAGDCMYYAQKSDAVYGGGSFFYKSYTKNPAYGYPVRCQKE